MDSHVLDRKGNARAAISQSGKNRNTIMAFVVPGIGHITPMVPVIRYFVNKGYRARVYTTSSLSAYADKAGASLVCLDGFFDLLEGDEFARAFNPMAMLELLRLMDEWMAEEIRAYNPAFALVDSQTAWGRMLAWKYHIPMIISSATMVLNRLTMKEYFHEMDQPLKILEERGVLEEKMKALTERGFPGRDAYSLYGVAEEEDCVVYASKELHPCAGSLNPDHTCFAGYAEDPGRRVGRDASARPLIYISMGTSSFNTGFLFRNCVLAFKDRKDVDVLMAVGSEENVKLLGKLPEHIRAAAFVDQGEVLKRTDVLIFHGGMNTLRDGLLAGIPMVIIPRGKDQGGNGKRMEELGAGIVLDNSRPEMLRRAVRLLLSVPSYRIRAGEIGENMRKCGGPEAVGQWIISRLGLKGEAEEK